MPISMLIVLSTIYSFLYHIFKIDLFQVDIAKQNTDPKIARFYHIIDGNYVYLTLGSLPLLTLSSCLFFKKAKLNFAEHLILNTYAACQRLIIHLVFLTVLVSISEVTLLKKRTGIQFLAGFILYLWCFNQFFYDSKLKVLFLSISSWLLAYVLTLIFLILLYYVI